MNIALDVSGQRISPFPNAAGTCQICEERLIAHCGEINAWHWQHRYDRNCDPWKEHETEWHRAWKAKFPTDWQEIVMQNDYGEKHIADIKTTKGIILEFQNSSISTSTIRTREEFYEDMVWIVNASSFKHNFKMWSAVKQELRQIHKSSLWTMENLEQTLNAEISKLKSEITEVGRSKKSKIQEMKVIQENLDAFKSFAEDPTKSANRILAHWTNHGLFDTSIRTLEKKIDATIKDEYRQHESSRKLKRETLEKHEATNRYVHDKPTLVYQNRELKIVRYDEVTAANYSKLLVINKDSMNSLFTEGAPVKSELEFNNLYYRLNDIIIAIDPTEAFEKIGEQIRDAQRDLDITQQHINEIRDKLVLIIPYTAAETISALEKTFEVLEDEFVKITDQEFKLEHELSKLETGKPETLAASKRETDQENSSDRFRAMQTYKGIYYFDWKHERKTWQYADMPVYFDMGEGFLFRRLREHKFLKVSYAEFVRDYSANMVGSFINQSNS